MHRAPSHVALFAVALLGGAPSLVACGSPARPSANAPQGSASSQAQGQAERAAAGPTGSSSSSAASGPTVKAASPPADDGSPAEGGAGGEEHAAALEELKSARMSYRVDRQRSIRLLLPDAPHWTQVKFFGKSTLVGFRYGKSHHAIVAGTVVHVHDESAPGACSKAFESSAQPLVDAFDVELAHDPPKATTWTGKIIDIDTLVATTATLGVRDRYAVAYATYPAWRGGCLVLGIAIPARGELSLAVAARDRYVAEAFPKVQVVTPDEPKERY